MTFFFRNFTYYSLALIFKRLVFNVKYNYQRFEAIFKLRCQKMIILPQTIDGLLCNVDVDDVDQSHVT